MNTRKQQLRIGVSSSRRLTARNGSRGLTTVKHRRWEIIYTQVPTSDAVSHTVTKSNQRLPRCGQCPHYAGKQKKCYMGPWKWHKVAQKKGQYSSPMPACFFVFLSLSLRLFLIRLQKFQPKKKKKKRDIYFYNQILWSSLHQDTQHSY